MKVYITWEEVEQFVDAVIDKYKDANLSGVYGVPRGGLILGVILSNRMDIPLLTAPTKNCLIVDDICDTGESLIHYVNNSSGVEKYDYHIVTLCYKENSFGIVPELYAKTKENDWIVFPWEERSL